MEDPHAKRKELPESWCWTDASFNTIIEWN